MSNRPVANALVVILASAGCGQQLYVDGHAAAPEEYESAVVAAPAPPPRPIVPVCSVKSADLNFATITCRYGGNPSLKDWQVGLTVELKLAAQTAIIAGKPVIASVSREEPEVRVGNYTSPRACTRTVNGLRAFGAVLAGMGGAYQDRAHCDSSGGSTDCTFSPAQRAPDVHDTNCVGGETTTYVAGVTTTGTWRFLTEDEARSPTMALLPAEKRPLSCQALLDPDFSTARKRPRPKPTDGDLAPDPFSDQTASPPTSASKPWVDPFVQ